MTYENSLAGRIEGDRIDQVAEWLEASLGPRLTAFSVRVTPLRLGKIAHGDEQPGEQRVGQRPRSNLEAARFEVGES